MRYPKGLYYVVERRLAGHFAGVVIANLLVNLTKQNGWIGVKYKDKVAADEFKDVWTDETSIQLETHRRFCCRKQGERPNNKPRHISVHARSVMQY